MKQFDKNKKVCKVTTMNALLHVGNQVYLQHMFRNLVNPYTGERVDRIEVHLPTDGFRYDDIGYLESLLAKSRDGVEVMYTSQELKEFISGSTPKRSKKYNVDRFCKTTN
jgi:hypothetical protein